jgi:hypothetical protein
MARVSPEIPQRSRTVERSKRLVFGVAVRQDSRAALIDHVHFNIGRPGLLCAEFVKPASEEAPRGWYGTGGSRLGRSDWTLGWHKRLTRGRGNGHENGRANGREDGGRGAQKTLNARRAGRQLGAGR